MLLLLAQRAVVEDVVVDVEVGGAIGATVLLSWVVVVDVTGGVEEQAATRSAAEAQRAKRMIEVFFIGLFLELIQEFGCGTGGNQESGGTAEDETEDGWHKGEFESDFG